MHESNTGLFGMPSLPKKPRRYSLDLPKLPSRNDVREWLMQHGAPLEMRLARQLDDIGFPVQQSVYWVDQETEKSLEIDLSINQTLMESNANAILNAFLPRDIEVVYLIECKVIRNHPWVIFRKHSHPSGGSWLDLPTSPKSFSYLAKIFSAPLVPEIDALGVGQGIHGYGVTIFNPSKSKDSDDSGHMAYSAMKKISKAAQAFAKPDPSLWQPLARIVIPVIVVAGDLYSASLGTSGRLSLTPTRSAHVHWSGNVDPSTHCRIQIITESAAKDYFTGQKRDIDRLRAFASLYADLICLDDEEEAAHGSLFWEQAIDPNSSINRALAEKREFHSLVNRTLVTNPKPLSTKGPTLLATLDPDRHHPEPPT